MTPTTIVVADDHPVVRQGLRALFTAESDFAVVGEEGDGLRTLELVERLKPNVLVLDLMMPRLNGLEVTRRVAKSAPATRVLILSMHASEAYVIEALRNGAVGYALKDVGPAELVKGVRDIAAGRRYLSPPLSERAIEAYLQKAAGAPFDPYATLTAREREVLQLAAESFTSTQIGDRLGISTRTAETHRSNLMRKLDLHSQVDVVCYARARGLVAPGL